MRARQERNSGRLLTIEQLQAYCGIGRNSAMKFGREAGAEIRIGRRVLFDRERIDKAIEKLAGPAA